MKRRIIVVTGVTAALGLLVAALMLGPERGEGDATRMPEPGEPRSSVPSSEAPERAPFGRRMSPDEIRCPSTDGWMFGNVIDGPGRVYADPARAWEESQPSIAPHLIPAPDTFDLVWLAPDQGAQLAHFSPGTDAPDVLVQITWGTPWMIGEGPGWYVAGVRGCSSVTSRG